MVGVAQDDGKLTGVEHGHRSARASNAEVTGVTSEALHPLAVARRQRLRRWVPRASCTESFYGLITPTTPRGCVHPSCA